MGQIPKDKIKLVETISDASNIKIDEPIAYVTQTTLSVDDTKDIIDELKKNGQSLFSREVGNFDLEQARQAARKMFSKDEIPDAVFVANDHMAFAVMDVIRFELGIKIPEQVSVVGYDDVPVAAWPAYSLSTVRQPAKRMVAETVSILIDCIENNSTIARRIEIDGPLIERGSVKILKK